MDERKTRLMARNMLKQQTPHPDHKKKKGKVTDEESAAEEQAKKRKEEAEVEATHGDVDGDGAAGEEQERDLPSIGGDNKRKRAPRGGARNVKQKMDGEVDADPKTAEATEIRSVSVEEEVGDEAGTHGKQTYDEEPGNANEKEVAVDGTPDVGKSRRESSRLRVKYRDIIPTLEGKLKSEDGRIKSLEAEVSVEVQALEEGDILIGTDRISDVYKRRDKKKVAAIKAEKDAKVAEKEEFKAGAADAKPASGERKDAKPLAAERKEGGPGVSGRKDSKASVADRKVGKAGAAEKEGRLATVEKRTEKREARTPEKKQTAGEKKDAKTGAGEKDDAKTHGGDRKEGRPSPAGRRDAKSSSSARKDGKSAGNGKDEKLATVDRKDKKVKIALKVKPPAEAADTAMVDVPLKDSDENGLKTALQVVKRVMKLKDSEPFNSPVDPVALKIPDYFDIIKDPMDLGTIRETLEKGRKYQNTEDVLRDVQLVWSNCRKYNNNTDPVVELMQTVEAAFIKLWVAAGLQYVPPKKLAAKALLGYTVSGSENAGRFEQHSQKQAKGQGDARPQAEKVQGDKKLLGDQKVQSDKEPIEDSRSTRKRKAPPRSVHFEALTPPKSKAKRSAPVEHIMAESMGKEQRVDTKEGADQKRAGKGPVETNIANVKAGDNAPLKVTGDQRVTGDITGAPSEGQQDSNEENREQGFSAEEKDAKLHSVAVVERDVEATIPIMEQSIDKANALSDEQNEDRAPGFAIEGRDDEDVIAVDKEQTYKISYTAKRSKTAPVSSGRIDNKSDEGTTDKANEEISSLAASPEKGDEAPCVAASQAENRKALSGAGKKKGDETSIAAEERADDYASIAADERREAKRASAADDGKNDTYADDRTPALTDGSKDGIIIILAEEGRDDGTLGADDKGNNDHVSTAAQEEDKSNTLADGSKENQSPNAVGSRNDASGDAVEKRKDDKARKSDKSHGSKRKDERSHSKKKKDHKSHSSTDKGKDGTSSHKSKDSKSHSSREKGEGRSEPGKGKDSKEETPVTKSKDDKAEPVSLRRRDDKNRKEESAKGKDQKAENSKPAVPKKDDKSKRINGTQHHREDCPCVVCKGRRRKLAGLAQAERKAARKQAASLEGAQKSKKQLTKEHKQLVDGTQKDGKASPSNIDEADGWEADDHFDIFDAEAADASEAENVRFYPASYEVPPRKISPVVYDMSRILFGSNSVSLWSKRPLLRLQPHATVASPLFQEICSVAKIKGS